MDVLIACILLDLPRPYDLSAPSGERASRSREDGLPPHEIDRQHAGRRSKGH